MIVDELLTYATYHLNNSTLENIKKLIINFYTAEEILTSKKVLWEAFGNYLETFTDRKTTERRTSEEANLDDVLKALINLDSKNVIFEFVSKDLHRLPNRSPEELNVTSMLERISNLEDNFRRSNDTLSYCSLYISDLESLKKSENKIQLLENKVQEHGVALADIVAREKILQHDQEENINGIHLNTTDSDSNWVDLDSDDDNGPRYIYDKHIVNKKTKKNTIKRKKRKNIYPKNSIELKSNRQVLDYRNNLCDKNSNYSSTNYYNNYQFKENIERVRLEGAPPKIKHLYIGNVDIGTEKTIRDYIWEGGLDCIDVNKVSRDSSSLKSFKLTVTADNYHFLLRSNTFWPPNVVIKPWIDFKSKQHYKNKEFFNSKFRFTNDGRV